MDVNRLFRRLAWLQVMLGALSFCLTLGADNPLALLAVVVLGAVHLWMTERRSQRTLPQPLLLLGVVIGMVWLARILGRQQGDPVQAMGFFILWLQLLLLFGSRSNREYGELLLLSLMLMVGVSVREFSVLFGLTLAVYVAVAMLTVFVFQFKITGDGVATAMQWESPSPRSQARRMRSPPVGRGFRWHFRLTTASLGLAAAVVAAAVFILMPRSDQQRESGSSRDPRAQTRTVGFTPEVRLDAPPPVEGSREVVLHMTVRRDGQSAGGDDIAWRVRGAALDAYDRQSRRWVRSSLPANLDYRVRVGREPVEVESLLPQAPVLEVDFQYLAAPSSRQLFTLFPVAEVQSGSFASMVVGPADHSLAMGETQAAAIAYRLKIPAPAPSGFFADSAAAVDAALAPYREARQTGGWLEEMRPWGQALAEVGGWVFASEHEGRAQDMQEARKRSLLLLSNDAPDRRATVGDFWLSFRDVMPYAAATRIRLRPGMFEAVQQYRAGMWASTDPVQMLAEQRRAGRAAITWVAYAQGWHVEPDAVRALALEVLAARGLSPVSLQDNGLRVAEALETYVRDNHTYLLDFEMQPSDLDPTLAFLLEHRRGHCELFASALAAMARSIGMKARVITGYLATEYDASAERYNIRKSNAHAWTEIWCGPEIGWREFDATPGEVVQEQHRPPTGLVNWMLDLYDRMQFTWIGSVVAFDTQSRSRLMDQFNEISSAIFGPPVEALESLFGGVRDVTRERRVGFVNAALTLIMLGAAAVAGVALIRSLSRRHHLSLPAWIRALPRGRRRRLAQQLAFYSAMLDLLRRHGFRPSPGQTPLAFAQTLARNDPARLGPVVPLTEVFYEVRFGDRDLDEPRQRQVDSLLLGLKQALTRAEQAG